MGNRYWKVKGEPKEKIKNLFAKVDACLADADKYAKTLGARVAYSYRFGLSLCFLFDSPPDAKVWRKDKHGQYFPKKSSSEGKVIDSKISKIENACPCNTEFGKIITAGKGYGTLFQNPGISVHGDDVYVETGDFYSPPESLKKLIVRVSDIEFEKATGSGKKKAKGAA